MAAGRVSPRKSESLEEVFGGLLGGVSILGLKWAVGGKRERERER